MLIGKICKLIILPKNLLQFPLNINGIITNGDSNICTEMATLNKTEKLIHNAATGNNLFEAKVFNCMLEFYEALDYSINTNMHCEVICYLYCGKHKGETFDHIARSFNRSVSTLEGNRKEYQKMFLFFYKKLERQESSAA